MKETERMGGIYNEPASLEQPDSRFRRGEFLHIHVKVMWAVVFCERRAAYDGVFFSLGFLFQSPLFTLDTPFLFLSLYTSFSGNRTSHGDEKNRRCLYYTGRSLCLPIYRSWCDESNRLLSTVLKLLLPTVHLLHCLPFTVLCLLLLHTKPRDHHHLRRLKEPVLIIPTCIICPFFGTLPNPSRDTTEGCPDSAPTGIM
jgi:hypothetical protein